MRQPSRRSVYLDHNATTPMRPEAKAAMAAAFEVTGNPSSPHRFGREARRLIEDGRETLAGLLGCRPAEIVFTSGATEANNWALTLAGTGRLWCSAVEHQSVLAARPNHALAVTAEGRLDLEQLTEAGAGEGDFVAVMAANNETGVIQPVHDVAELRRSRGFRLHVDATQVFGRMPFDARGLAGALVAVSSHKLGGPGGVGALVVPEETPMPPLIRGGGQERRLRGGTENVAGIAGFAAAAAAACADPAGFAGLAAWRDRLEAALIDRCGEKGIPGRGVERLANTAAIRMPGVRAETQLMAFDLDGIAVSSGSACSSGKVGASHVLAAMGLAPEVAAEVIRVSLGWTTTADDVDAFVEAWRRIHDRHRGRRAA